MFQLDCNGHTSVTLNSSTARALAKTPVILVPNKCIFCSRIAHFVEDFAMTAVLVIDVMQFRLITK